MDQRPIKQSHDARESSQTKRPYRPPTLREFGAIQTLTQGQAGTMSDGSSGMAMP